jgi:hypothetical protein
MAQCNRAAFAAPLLAHSSVLAEFPAWKAARRPASAVQPPALQWQLPLPQLQQAIQEHLKENFKTVDVCSTEHVCQGRVFDLLVQLSHVGQQSTGLGFFVRVKNLAVGAVSSITYALTIRVAPPATPGNFQQLLSTAKSVTIGPFCANFTRNSNRYGQKDAVTFGQTSTWAAAEAKLRELRLVHGDGCLHMEALLTSIL